MDDAADRNHLGTNGEGTMDVKRNDRQADYLALAERMDDLAVQATKERSHYYVRKCAVDAAAALREAHARLNTRSRKLAEAGFTRRPTWHSLPSDWTMADAEREIERLTGNLKIANSQAEHFEREWYLRGDEIERLRALLLEARAMCEDGDGLIDSEKLAARIDAELKGK
jgi:hypothetical protein